jgi:Glyoxalase-like domain
MSAQIKLISVALDCPSAGELAAFYAEITGGKVIFADQRWAIVQAPGARIDFQTAPDYRPPTWPDSTSSMQMHLDFYLGCGEARLRTGLAAGLTQAGAGFAPTRQQAVIFPMAG